MTVLWLIVMAIFVSGCAGPMTPFGALNGLVRRELHLSVSKSHAFSQPAQIRFWPRRQVLHTATSFSVIIRDSQPIPENYTLILTYNGINVTSRFLAAAEKTFLDPSHHQLKLTTRNLRLLPSRDNQVLVSYERPGLAQPIIAQYEPPTCSAFRTDRKLASVPEFETSPEVVNLINRFSEQKNFNPNYVAGLIAQESSFDPHALSRNRALGLTQITPLSESEVIPKFTDWPQYPGIDAMALWRLKWNIVSGRITARNEWRLDPAKSIEGGVEYLAYLDDYWQRPDKKSQIIKYVGGSDFATSQVLLASYNSGPARVSQALARSKANWLRDNQLNEAKKYVNRVVSYCDYFAHDEAAR